MIGTNDDTAMDSLIERTLSKDAEKVRNRFAPLPSSALTAKLALTTASRGLFTSLGAKLALYTAGAIVLGTAAYFIPTLTQPARTHPNAVSKPVVQSPAVASPSQPVAPSTVTPAPTSIETPRASIITHAHKTNPMRLDESEPKNIHRYIDTHYGSPIK